MAVAYVNVGTRSSFSGSTSATPALPGSRTNGNVLIAEVMTKNGATHSLSGSGWTAIHAQQFNGTSMTVSRWWRWVDGSEAAPTISWTSSAAGYARIAQFSRPNYDQAAPPFGAESHNAGTGTTHSSTGLTTTRNGSQVLYFDSGSANTGLATPSGWSERSDVGSATGASRSTLGSKAVATSGSGSGNISVTGASGVWIQSQIEVLDAVLPGDIYTVSADGEDVSDNGSGSYLSQRLYQGTADSGSSMGVRFNAVAVDQGSTINSAFLALYASNSIIALTGTTWGSIFGDDVDDAAAWGSGNRPSGITKTTASTPFLASATDGALIVLDVTAIVQEIVNRGGWATGNDLRLAGDPTGADGTARYYDRSQNSAFAAQLAIDWTGGGTPSVTPNNSAHTHTASSPTIAAKSSVTPNSAANTNVATSPTIAAKSTIAPASTAHINAASSPSLATANTVAPDSAAHVNAATSPTVGVSVAITPDSAASVSTSGEPTIAAKSVVTLDNAASVHATTSPTLATNNQIAPDSTAHLTISTSPTIAAASTVAPDGSNHLTVAGSPTIAAKSAVEPDDAAHDTSATSPTLAVPGNVTVNSGAHDTAATEPTISAKSVVTVDGAAHLVVATSPSIAAKSAVSVDSAAHTTASTEPSLSVSLAVVVGSGAHLTVSTSPSIAWAGQIAANDSAHDVVSGSPSVFIETAVPANRHATTRPGLTAATTTTTNRSAASDPDLRTATTSKGRRAA